MGVTPDRGRNASKAGSRERGKRTRTSKYQKSGDASVLSEQNVCLKPVTDHYCSLRVKAVPMKNALRGSSLNS
jgi:hypothetical protein